MLERANVDNQAEYWNLFNAHGQEVADRYLAVVLSEPKKEAPTEKAALLCPTELAKTHDGLRAVARALNGTKGISIGKLASSAGYSKSYGSLIENEFLTELGELCGVDLLARRRRRSHPGGRKTMQQRNWANILKLAREMKARGEGLKVVELCRRADVNLSYLANRDNPAIRAKVDAIFAED